MESGDSMRFFIERILQHGESIDGESVQFNMNDVRAIVRKYPREVPTYVTKACEWAAHNPEYLRLAAILAAVRDSEFSIRDPNHSMLQLVIKRSQELGMEVYRGLLEWICDTCLIG